MAVLQEEAGEDAEVSFDDFKAKLEGYWNQLDLNGDGKVDPEEYVKYV